MYQPIDLLAAPLRQTVPLPTMYDLPSEDPEELGLADEFHDFQPKLLRETCQPPDLTPEQYFIGADLNLYYDLQHPLWHKRPDWFLVLGVASSQAQTDMRLSYVTWQEGRNPFLVVELLSPGTEAEDLGQTLREISRPPTKWQVYEQILRIPYYVLFDRYTLIFRVFRLMGTRYEELPIADRRYWFEDLNLGLGVFSGQYKDIQGEWLRWYDASGNWIPNDRDSREQAENLANQAIDRANQAEDRADQAEAQATQAIDRAERLAAQLRALGIDPDAVDG
jgi:Uma2 family endonuclease